MPASVEVFGYGLVTALATGLGAIPFAFTRRLTRGAVAYADAIAAGLMLGASFALVAEGTKYGTWQTIVGANVGVLFILGIGRLLRGRDLALGSLSGAGARRALLVIVTMTVHSFAEGVAVGVAFGGGSQLGLLITIAIAVHNIPEGLAISASLRSRGSTITACTWWSIFSSLPQPLMAVPAFLFVELFTPFLPYGLGFAAGAMIFMVFEELLPEAYGEARSTRVALFASLMLVAMVLFEQYL